ncbi:MAG: S9 family peptidase [Phycisphaerales bacterium]|nr:S9 family peptidase [Phycisphaerales bacterium]
MSWRVAVCLSVAASAALAQSPQPKPQNNPEPRPAGPASPTPDGVALIPREVLFGNPDRAGPQLSHDGRQLSFLAAVDGVLNVWVAPVEDLAKARPVTGDKNRGIRQYFWAYTNQHIIYLQDQGGDENWRLYSVDLGTGKTLDLTPFPGVQAQVQGLSPQRPGQIVIGLNNRNPMYHDLHIVDITTGTLTPLLTCPDGFAGFTTDEDWKVRFGLRMTPDGGGEMLRAVDGGVSWEPALKIAAADMLTTGPLGFTRDGKTFYMRDSRDRDTSALISMDPQTGATKVIAENKKADFADALSDPVTGVVQAAGFNYLKNEWTVVDPAVAPDLEYLGKLGGEVDVLSRTLDDRKWMVAVIKDDGPVKYYLYDRSGPERKARFLFTNREKLAGYKLAPMEAEVIKARDGLDMVSYLTVPLAPDGRVVKRPSAPLPMVLLVHGGPWARDSWGYNGLHQLLANRGYAVLSVNYRGSTGFGKSFINAADKEWAGKMHDDLLDAVDWAVKNKVADPRRIAIMGGSYGGYATLVGLTFTPDVFVCGVDIVGPSNLVTLLNSIPPYWAPMIEMFTTRVGDHRTDEGRKLLESRSPLNKADKITKPLLIGQGANDPRVKQAEADQIVDALKTRNIPVTYVLYPDEGHGFARPENNLSFFAVSEAFLSQYLGGRYEPIGQALKKSSAQVRYGAEHVPGLTGPAKPE